MARKQCRPSASAYLHLKPVSHQCWGCGQSMWVAYHTTRTITRLDGLHHLTLHVRRCRNHECSHYHRAYRPEEEGQWALPRGLWCNGTEKWFRGKRFKEQKVHICISPSALQHE